MKSLKYIMLLLFATMLCSTHGYAKSLKKTVWANVVEVEKEGVSGKIITTLYMGKKNQIEVYQSILHKDQLEEFPYLFATGTYRCKSKNKQLHIRLDMENLMKEKIACTGMVLNNGLVLLMPDGSVEAFAYVRELLVPDNMIK